MNTREIASEYRLAHWAKVMQERKERGQSIKAFCESEGMHTNVYYYWQRKLREAACEQLSKNQESTPALSAFAEVKLADEYQQLARREDSHNDEILIETAGVRITAGSAFPMEVLAVLLREMTRSC